MTRINLLDWRSERRQQRKQQFIAMLVMAGLVGGALFGAGYVYIETQISFQETRNNYLKQQITEVDQKIKEIQELEKVKSNLLARMNIINELQASRTATVRFFDEIVNTLPEGVSITAIHQTGAAVTIDGTAESNGRVSTYMKNLEASDWFDDPKLVVIKSSDAKSNTRKSDFTLQVTNLKNGAAGKGKPVTGEATQ